MNKTIDKTSGNTTITWIENLRAVSAIAVVLLHISAQMTYSFGKIPNVDWWASNLYESLTRFCVPCFLLITGALTLGKPYELSSFFKKRFPRILIPFLFWSLIYIIYNLSIYYLKSGKSPDIIYIVDYSWNKLTTGASYQMWYIYILIGIYLIHPVINKWIIHSTKNEQLYFIFVCLFMALVKYIPIPFLQTSIDFSFFSEFLGFVVLGYFLFNVNIKGEVKIVFLLLVFLYFLSYFLICYDTYYASVKNNSFTEQFKPWDILQVFAIFSLFKINKFFNKRSKLLSLISKYSYGIYLIHVLIMDFLAKAGLAYYSFNPYLSIPVILLCTVFFSTLILYIIDKLPLGKYIVK